MFEDYYFDDPALQGLLAAAAGPIMDTPRQPAVMPMTTETAPAIDLASLDLSGLNNLYGMNFGSDFGGGLQGGGIYPTNPDLKLFKAPLSSKGNPTAYGDNYIQVKSPTQVFRLFDKNTGKVVYEGVGYEGAQEAINRASALTAEEGAKAQWQIQTPNPQQESGYSIIASEKRNQSTVGDIASVALPIAMAALTGGMSLPAQIAGAAMAGAAGAGLAGKDPLKGGLISAATAGLGNVSGFNEAVGGALSNASDAVTNALLPEIAKQAAASAGGDIVVTGLSNLAQGAASGLLQGAASGLTSGLGDVTVPQPVRQPVQEPVQPPVETAVEPIVVSGSRVPFGSELPFASALPAPVEAILSGALTAAQPTPAQQPTVPQPEEIVVTGTRPTEVNLGGVLGALTPTIPLTPTPPSPPPIPEEIVVTGAEKPVIPTEALAAVPVVGGLLAATGGTAPNVVNGIDQATGDIVVEAAPKPVVPPPPIVGVETALPAITGGALTAAQTAGTPPPSEKGGVLGTGLTLPQLLSIGGIGADLLQNLLSGGGGAGAGVPYVSPFGPGVGIGAGRDMRANPNITDYERYGFGPEAMFFQPGYGLLSSAAPATPQAPPAMTINPVYQPLI